MRLSLVIKDAHFSRITSIAYIVRVGHVITGSQEGLVHEWDVETGAKVQTFRGPSAKTWVTGVEVKDWGDHYYVFVSAMDGFVYVFTEKGLLLQSLDLRVPLHAMVLDDSGSRSVLYCGSYRCAEAFSVVEWSRTREEEDVNTMFVQVLKRKVERVQAHEDTVTSMAVNEDGKLFTVSNDRRLVIYDEDNMERYNVVHNAHDSAILSVVAMAGTDYVITGGFSGEVKVWAADGHCMDHIKNPLSNVVSGLTFLESLGTLWAAGKGGHVQVFDVRSSPPEELTEMVHLQCGFDDQLVDLLQACADNRHLVGTTTDHSILIWEFDPYNAHRVHRVDSDENSKVNLEAICVVDKNDDDEEVASTSLAQSASRVEGGDALSEGPAFASPSDKVIVCTATSRGTVVRWRLSPETMPDMMVRLEEQQVHAAPIQCMLYAPDADRMVTGGEDGLVKVFSVRTEGSSPEDIEQIAIKVELEQSGVVDEAAEEERRRAAAKPKMEEDEPEVIEDGDTIHTLEGHQGAVMCMAYCGDFVLCSGGADCCIIFWDLHTRVPMRIVEDAHGNGVSHMTYAPSLHQVATSALGDQVKVWDALKHTLLYVLSSGVEVHVNVVAWCPFVNAERAGGSWMTASSDQSLRAWCPPGRFCREVGAPEEPGAALVDLDAPAEVVAEVFWKGDMVTAIHMDTVQELVVLAMTDMVLRVYSPKDRELRKLYRGHGDNIRGIAQVTYPGKNQYLSIALDRTLHIWQAELPAYMRKEFLLEQLQKESEDAKSRKKSDRLVKVEEFVSEYEKKNPLTVPRALGQRALQEAMIARAIMASAGNMPVNLGKDVIHGHLRGSPRPLGLSPDLPDEMAPPRTSLLNSIEMLEARLTKNLMPEVRESIPISQQPIVGERPKIRDTTLR